VSQVQREATNLGLEASGDAGLEGVAEVPHHAQPRVVLGQPAQTQNPTRPARVTSERGKLSIESGTGGREKGVYLVLTHAAQQEGRLDPSQSAQQLLVLPRRDAIISLPIRRGGSGAEAEDIGWLPGGRRC
jgi:hypothetical protein